ncbi:MAG: DUF3656 domain-containing U32 family peptidase [Bacilli bacterium]
MSPASNWEMIRAGVANGADAIFFGIDKFNARVRAKNFQIEDLPEIMTYLHTYDVKGFVTLNILMFEDELESAESLIRACMDAGVDALIVQDVGLVELIRSISPDFPIHGSTQMTVTSPEAVHFFDEWNLEVMVLGRENNMKHIETIANSTNVPLEVFVHGALCVSYSGQCLTSEVLGGRSANRGECAQACRLPYDMHVDGKTYPLGDVAYVLSPKDLAAIDIVPELIEAGVHTFKIEGRLKSPEYVANVTQKYRAAIDAYFNGVRYQPSVSEVRELEQSFSRGFTHGFLSGTNHRKLLDGTFPKSRGVFVGEVLKVERDRVLVRASVPLKRGDGIVFDRFKPQEKEEGGRIYDLFDVKGNKIEGEVRSGNVWLTFGRGNVNTRYVFEGNRIWKTSDPALEKRLQQTFKTEENDLSFPVAVTVEGEVGGLLTMTWTDLFTGARVSVSSEEPVMEAIKRPLDETYLFDQLGRLGDTIFHLETLDVKLGERCIVPVKTLNAMRRAAAQQLTEMRKRKREFTIHETSILQTRQIVPAVERTGNLVALCRTLEQVKAAALTDIKEVVCDFEFLNQYKEAVAVAREAGKPIVLATPRIHMPGENGFLRTISRLEPDGILVRSLGALYFYRTNDPGCPLIGDYSLNISNSLSAEAFLSRGITRYTPSYDLNIQQMVDLLAVTDAEKVELTIHQHLPMFHTEHCVYCTFLTENGTDWTNCGRPCEEHRISLEDRVGMKHPVRVDAGCRNTVFNAVEQSGAEYIREFQKLGVGTYRVEFLEEDGAKVKEVIELYSEAIRGERTGTSVWRSLKATNQLGVTRGQLVKENFSEKKLPKK